MDFELDDLETLTDADMSDLDTLDQWAIFKYEWHILAEAMLDHLINQR